MATAKSRAAELARQRFHTMRDSHHARASYDWLAEPGDRERADEAAFVRARRNLHNQQRLYPGPLAYEKGISGSRELRSSRPRGRHRGKLLGRTADRAARRRGAR